MIKFTIAVSEIASVTPLMEEHTSSNFLVLSCALVIVFAIVAVLLGALGIALILPALAPADAATSVERAHAFPTTPPPDGSRYMWQVFATGFDNPVFVTHAGDGTGRLYAVEQGGFVWIVEPDGRQRPYPFLEMPLLTSPDVMRGTYSERGLLSLAFDPAYETNRTFYIAYTDRQGDSAIARVQTSRVNPDRADHNSMMTILGQDQPYYDHNGGQIAFGPDGYLYVGFGDGGSIDDPQINAQNTGSLLGKLLRIDVRGNDTYAVPSDNPFVGDPAYRPEIWAVGFRNPWRFSFDRATGDLYVADVGQWTWEEWNFQPASSRGGENYGWNLFEANLQRAAEVPADFTYVPPAIAYDHTQGCSITGGYVYRGAALPELNGYYFYGDYCSGRVWAAWRDETGAWQSVLFHETSHNISSFGEDEAGELYLVDYKGDILRLTAADPTPAVEN